MLLVKKRDGRTVPFKSVAIMNAVDKATPEEYPFESHAGKEAADYITKLYHNSVEPIDMIELVRNVETFLMKNHPIIARRYIEYRRTRDIARSEKSQIIGSIMGILNDTDESILLENANKNSEIIPTKRDLVAGAAARQLARDHILPEHIVAAHDAGEIHYHDLDYAPAFPIFNCMLVDVKGMLKNGFKMGNAEIEEPKSISTACAITAQIIAQVASHIYGGTSIDNMDIILAPYVTKSYEKHLKVAGQWIDPQDRESYAMERTQKECNDAFQALEYEVNTLHTSNGQTPFVTFAFGRGTSWESKMIQLSILKIRTDGLGKNHKTAIFPKLVFYIEKGVNLDKTDPNYHIKIKALECSAKRLYPDYLSVEALTLATGSVKAPMGCRSFLAPWTNPETGLIEHDGRNNLGVVSINLPRIALESEGDYTQFWDILDERLELCFEALETRIDRLRNVKASVAPILYTEGACGKRLNPDDNIMQLFEDGRASISLGYIGLHETAFAMTGKTPFNDFQSRTFTLDIVSHMRRHVNKWKAMTGFGYSLYSTPSENLCDRFCRLDTAKYGVVAGVTDREYYTNSFHLDVAEQTDPFSKFDFESNYPWIASGGFITYAEFPDMKNNIEGLERVVDYAYSSNPYIGINTPSDQCYECGYEGETSCTSKGFMCPKCGNRDITKMSVIRRICGYLGAENGVNHGKYEEMKRRVKHQ